MRHHSEKVVPPVALPYQECGHHLNWPNIVLASCGHWWRQWRQRLSSGSRPGSSSARHSSSTCTGAELDHFWLQFQPIRWPHLMHIGFVSLEVNFAFSTNLWKYYQQKLTWDQSWTWQRPEIHKVFFCPWKIYFQATSRSFFPVS